MFNYYSLNDVEFEDLCKDVLERMLSVNLRIFTKGKDGGIDLTDSPINNNIIVQVKHYIGSTFANLKSTLKKEAIKVNNLCPKQYYLCCGMKLTASNISEIYNMFSVYMKSDKNIITLIEIDEFLQKDENSDIVRKHYKLWLYASGILNQVFNQNIFIDCETLLSDIEDECKYFVPTKIFNQCIECLDKHRIIMITGHPGVGKTITSKMLVLHYASQEYSVRYTTNGDISDIKRSLINDKKEIILLDDCLGQHYFRIKDNQENELTSLTKYVKIHKNKKLILNSRITILNEARERFESFNLFLKEKKIDNITINMDDISPLEKAKIFYNHLIYKQVPKVFYTQIRESKNYFKIVMHKNYTPRIIEYVTLSSNYSEVPTNKYVSYILEKLNNPTDVWKNEYCQRLQDVDRAFLNTLYSLTDTFVGYDILKKCFEKRLSKMVNVDYILNNFEMVLARLNQSIVKIIENEGQMYIGVINPSVNDFLKQIFISNNLEVFEVRKAINNYSQLSRCYSESELPDIIDSMIKNRIILDIDFSSKKEKDYFIISHICEKEILDRNYEITIQNYLHNAFGCLKVTKELITHQVILTLLLSEPFVSFYNIKLNEELVKNILKDLDLNEIIQTVNILKKHSQCIFGDIYTLAIEKSIYDYTENINIYEYCEKYDLDDLINENAIHTQYGSEVNEKAVINNLSVYIEGDVLDDVYYILDGLDDISIKETINYIEINIDKSVLQNIIDSYLKPDPDDYDDYRSRTNPREDYEKEIAAIFER